MSLEQITSKYSIQKLTLLIVEGYKDSTLSQRSKCGGLMQWRIRCSMGQKDSQKELYYLAVVSDSRELDMIHTSFTSREPRIFSIV